MFTDKDLKSLCETAKLAAIAAGEYIQSQFDQQYEKRIKEGGESIASQIVTEVDVKAQKIILQHLKASIQQFDFGLLTEESDDDSSRLKKSYFWCIDPMDGTLAFTEGRTGYAVSIALVARSGDPIIGVVYIPDLQHCYTAIKGEGVCLNEAAFAPKTDASGKVQIYMDKSLLKESYYNLLRKRWIDWAYRNETTMEFHLGLGAVRNAIGVMNSPRATYFKFSKKEKGGGCIWDYAATRLFFEELGLIVSNISGQKLFLNNPETTFMNRWGVLYATDSGLFDFIMSLHPQINEF